MKNLVITAFAVVAFLAFIAVPLTGYAQTADDSIIYGCYKKVNGQLRVVDSPEKCRPSEESISWSEGGESGGIDLSGTSIKSCPNVMDCLCDEAGWVLNGYAECPAGAVLASLGTSDDGAGFHARCVSLTDGTDVNPANISIRCVNATASSAASETNCSDGIDDDSDSAIDCDDTDCASDTACQAAVPAEICSDEIDNDGDGSVDCDDTACLKNRACKKKKN